VQWDWVELPDPPAHWGHGAHAHLLVGALPHSGRWRGVLAESEDQAHLVEALHAVSARLGGLPRRWRFDRMATVASPNTGRVTATFAAVAKHYGVGVDLEALAPLAAPFPAMVMVTRVVTAQALVAFRGNTYSVPAGLAGAKVTVSHRLAAPVIDIATSGGTVVARHRRELDGAGIAVRDRVHVAALQTAVLAAFDTSKPCPRKVRRPPSPAALAAAAHLHADAGGADAGEQHVVVVDLAVWAAAARDRRVAP
jgi:hypothetical protein